MKRRETANLITLNLLFMQIAHDALRKSLLMNVNGSNNNGGGAEGKENSIRPDVDHEAAFYWIEKEGFQVGIRLIERLLANHGTPRFSEQLDIVKFICKEYWNDVFGKSIDNLKTNHRGVYVLQDNKFGWITRFSNDSASPKTAKMAILYLAFPCGLIRGALVGMGLAASVTAEIPAFPQCTFQIRTQSTAPPPSSSQPTSPLPDVNGVTDSLAVASIS